MTPIKIFTFLSILLMPILNNDFKSSPEYVVETIIKPVNPEFMMGAGCHYRMVSNNSGKTFAFVDAMSGELYMNIDNQNITFKYNPNNRNLYEAKGYSIKIEINSTASGTESVTGKGFITISAPNGELIKSIVYQYCGA